MGKKQKNVVKGKKRSKKSSKVVDKTENTEGATQEWIVEDDVDETENGGDREEEETGIAPDKRNVDFLSFEDDEKDEDIFEGLDISDNDEEDKKGSAGVAEAARAIIATRKNPMKRKEAARNAEEFVAVKKRVNTGEGGVNKFLQSIQETGDTKTAKKIAKFQESTGTEKNLKRKAIKTLDTPAERITSEKIKRTLLYDNAKEEVSKWNSIVYHNRQADQLVFPLSSDNKAFKKPPKNKNGTEFKPVTALEEEIAKVLYGEEFVARQKAEMAKDPAKTDMESYLLSVEEAMATHSEMAKLRALQSYAMAKSKRQNKIKSKKYHRLIRKSKIKQQMKEFEELQKKDPEAAMIKLEELERARVQERMSLKHRNTSKWAKMQSARAKYDKDSRIALSEQLKMSRDLTVKVQESSDEDDEDMELPQLVKASAENPWMLKSSLKDNEKLQMYYTGYKKFWDEYNRQLQKNKPEESESSEESDEEEETATNSRKSVPRSKDGDIDEIRELVVNEDVINNEASDDESAYVPVPAKSAQLSSKNIEDGSAKKLEVNPDNFLKVTKHRSSINQQFNAKNSQVVDLLEESEESDEDTERRNLIAEAFEDDDVVNEFKRMKNEDIEGSKPQDIDNFLPGWGSWTGKDVVPNERKKKKFVKKAKKGAPRKDARVSHVIISENQAEKIRPHQVKDLPFPFTRVKDFEKSVRAPIGRTWMPETAVKSLTAPKIITRLGQTIKPISANVLAKPKEKKFNVPNTIIRMAKVTKSSK